MRAILLAAGKGTRISRMIEPVPKCTLPIKTEPLIRYTVKMLIEKGMDITVCVGYKKEKIYEALEGFDIDYVINPFFEVTNSIASLWFAKERLDDDLFIMNADVFFSRDILDIVLEYNDDNVLAIDKSRIELGDYFFATSDNGCLKKYGKELPLKERSGEYVGISKISKSFLPTFVERLEKMIDDQQYNKWWENVIYSFTDKNEKNINTVDVKGKFWAEIDYFDDYERILNYLKSQEKRERDVCNEKSLVTK